MARHGMQWNYQDPYFVEDMDAYEGEWCYDNQSSWRNYGIPHPNQQWEPTYEDYYAYPHEYVEEQPQRQNFEDACAEYTSYFQERHPPPPPPPVEDESPLMLTIMQVIQAQREFQRNVERRFDMLENELFDQQQQMLDQQQQMLDQQQTTMASFERINHMIGDLALAAQELAQENFGRVNFCAYEESMHEEDAISNPLEDHLEENREFLEISPCIEQEQEPEMVSEHLEHLLRNFVAPPPLLPQVPQDEYVEIFKLDKCQEVKSLKRKCIPWKAPRKLSLVELGLSQVFYLHVVDDKRPKGVT